MLATFVEDPSERSTIFNDAIACGRFDHYADWLQDCADSIGLGERVLALAAIGSAYLGQHLALCSITQKHLLPGLGELTYRIMRDKSAFVNFACALLGHLLVRPSQKRIEEVVVAGTEAQCSFIASESAYRAMSSVNHRLGETAHMRMGKEYTDMIWRSVYNTADNLLVALGNEKYYN